jgi:ribosomal protein L22
VTYTFKPKENYAKAYGKNLKISTRSSKIVCRAINKKPLKRAKRLLVDLSSEKRSLRGKYYTNASKSILKTLESAQKNAEFMGLDEERLFVHAGSQTGPVMRRRRRKAGFGSRMKSTNIEIMLIERGKVSQIKKEIKKKVKEAVKEVAKEIKKEIPEEKIEE